MADSTPDPILDWLLASDPAIRWQAMRDLQHAPAACWNAERARVETEGWGARLLAAQDPDGQWAGGAFLPAGFESDEWQRCGQPWTATSFALNQLRELGLDPKSESARRTVELIGRNCRWDEGGQPYWEGETEECINGRTVADGAYFGVDVSAIVERLIGQQLADGGWNCERCNGSRRSSFHSTINVLEGLRAFERATGGTGASRSARQAGEAYLLQRHLFRRLATGETVDERFLSFLHPVRWRYDTLRGLDYFRSSALAAGAGRDARLADAIARLRARRLPGGQWPLDWHLPGRTWFAMEEVGAPSRRVTLRAMRVLYWWDRPRPDHRPKP